MLFFEIHGVWGLGLCFFFRVTGLEFDTVFFQWQTFRTVKLPSKVLGASNTPTIDDLSSCSLYKLPFLVAITYPILRYTHIPYLLV